MKKLLVILGCMLIMSLVLAVTANAEIVLKLGTILPESNILTKNAMYLAQRVEEKTDGRVKIVVYPSSQLGDERDQTEGLQIGTQEMAEVSCGVLSAFAPEVGLFGLPFIFRSWDHLNKALVSKPADKMKDIVLAKTGLRVLAWMEQGFRIIITTHKPINQLDDLKGMKIRLPEDKVLIRTFQLLGAAPTVIPWGEVYTALQTNVVEGMESTSPGIMAMNFCEVANYIAVTNHQHSVVALLISDRVYNSLSKEDQKALKEAAEEMRKVNYENAYKEASDALDKLSNNVKETTEPDIIPFQEAVAPIFDEFGEKTGTSNLIEEIKNIN